MNNRHTLTSLLIPLLLPDSLAVSFGSWLGIEGGCCCQAGADVTCLFNVFFQIRESILGQAQPVGVGIESTQALGEIHMDLPKIVLAKVVKNFRH